MSYSDYLIFHKAMLEKQKNRIFLETVRKLNALLPEINLIINSDKNTTQQINEIKKSIDNAYNAITDDVVTQLKSISAYELDFQYAIISSAVAYGERDIIERVSKELLYKAIFREPLEGLSFAQNMKTLSEALKLNTERAVRIGVLNGETIGDIKNRVTQQITIANHKHNSFIRTAVQNVTHKATQMSYEQNSNFIKKVQYVAILDSRTTDICRNLNGQVFDLNEGPRPPQHWNCRSFTVPIFDDEDLVNESYGDWVDRQNDKRLTKGEKGEFVNNPKDTLTIKQQKEIEEKRLGKKI